MQSECEANPNERFSAAQGRVCDSVLETFESDSVEARAAAARMCAACSFLPSCLRQTREEILGRRGPAGVVRAGVVWDDEGRPHPVVHGSTPLPDWVPPEVLTTSTPDIDEYLVELALSDPERVRGTSFTEEERDAVIRRAAATGRSMHWIRTTLSLHPRKVSAAVNRLGLRECFAAAR